MTNTSAVPTTSTGPVCGRCSYGVGRDRVQIRHASARAIGLCFSAPAQPVVAMPTVVEALTLIAETLPPEAPKPKLFGRYVAKCSRKGCKTSDVRNHPFTIWCHNHGRSVRVRARQLSGTYSDSPRRRCDPRCTGAVGAVCVCSCGGANHGVDNMNVAAQPV